MSVLRMRGPAIGIVISVLIAAAACGGAATGSSHIGYQGHTQTPRSSSTTTVPDIKGSPYVPAAITYLHGTGAPVVDFEQDTVVLGSGTPLSSDECKALQSKELPRLAHGKLFAQIDQIRDPVLNSHLTQDVQNKLQYIGECSEGKLSRSVTAEVESSSSTVHQLFVQLGLWK